MLTCTRCKRKIGLIESVFNYNETAMRCGDCDRQVKGLLIAFRQKIINMKFDSDITRNLNLLHDWSTKQNLNWIEAISFSRKDILGFLEDSLQKISNGDRLTLGGESSFTNLCDELLAHFDVEIANFRQKLDVAKYILWVRQGGLSVVNTDIHLNTGEVCHLEMSAAYKRPNTRNQIVVYGRLIATNQRLLFSSVSGGWEIPWKKVLSAKAGSDAVYIELSMKRGNGMYIVASPAVVEAILNTIIRKSKQQLSSSSKPNVSQNPREHIPDEVKIFVWQRDQGRCVRCSSQERLEYDHIIPISKGGSNTARNIQLLCEKCNRLKGAKIV